MSMTVEKHYVIYDDNGNSVTVRPDENGNGDIQICAPVGDEVEFDPVFVPALIEALKEVAKDLGRADR